MTEIAGDFDSKLTYEVISNPACAAILSLERGNECSMSFAMIVLEIPNAYFENTNHDLYQKQTQEVSFQSPISQAGKVYYTAERESQSAY